MWGPLSGANPAVFNPLGPVIAVSDTFTRADSTTTLGDTETGQTWTAAAGTWGITSNQAYNVTSGINKAVVDSQLNDGIFEVDLLSGNYSSEAPELTFRWIDTNNWLGVYLYQNQVVLASIIDGSATNEATAAVTLTNSQYYTVRAEASGTAINVYVDDVLKITYTLTGSKATLFTGAGATWAGIVTATAGTSMRFDNLLVQEI